MIRYALPTTDELIRLGARTPNAVSVCVPTDPSPAGREQARTAAKSGVDEGIRRLREAGASASDCDAVRAGWDALASDTTVWGKLSGSLAIFLAPGVSEEYVLPNSFTSSVQAGDYFDLSQLVRAVTAPQAAYALTLSTNGWSLWEASASARATPLELDGDYAEDAADATNRASIRGRGYQGRLVGDEGKKQLLERYAQTVVDAVRAELGKRDRKASAPLFVFANEPLLSMITTSDLPWQVVAVPGASDEARADRIDEVIRGRIGTITAQRLSAKADQIGHGFTDGLAVRDVAKAARAAVAGAVHTLIYDVNASVRGTFDDATGAIAFDDAGVDLLSRIAIAVLATGGTVHAVRADEISAQIWDGRLLAGLRHSLAG